MSASSRKMGPRNGSGLTAAQVAATRAGNHDRRRRDLGGLLDGLMKVRSVKHALLGVESLSGDFSWYGARGQAHPEGGAISPDTPFYIASIDKLFTSVVAMRLVERRLLDLAEPIATYLPASLVDGIHVLRGRDSSDRITVGHLLSHTSGLASYVEDRPKGGQSLFESLVTNGDRGWTIEETCARVRQELTPHFEPKPLGQATRIRYCDTNFALLHEIIGSITGQPRHEVFARELFEPLGLTGTWMAGHRLPAMEVGEPATLWVGDQPLSLPKGFESMGAIYSTLHDLLQFARKLAGGETFEQEATFGQMTARWKRFGFPLDPAALRAPSWPIEYGLGIKRFRLPSLLTGGKRMPELLGHSGSTGTWLFYSPDLELAIAGSVDQANAGAVPYRFLPKAMRVLANG